MAFKMKGNPMKRNFGIGAKPMTKINRGDDKGNPTAAFQKHDGKTFDDPGFMDSHFPSGAPRPMKLMKEKSPAKLVGKTIKKVKAKRAAKRAEKAGKGNLATAMSTAVKMKKKSPMTIKKDSAMDMKKPMKMKKKSAMKKTTYMLKKGGKKVKVSKAEYEKALGGKAGSKVSAMKMKKKSAMKRVGRMTDTEKAKAEQARIEKAYLQYQAAETDKIERGESVKKVMTFEEFKKKMG